MSYDFKNLILDNNRLNFALGKQKAEAMLLNANPCEYNHDMSRKIDPRVLNRKTIAEHARQQMALLNRCSMNRRLRSADGCTLIGKH